MNVRPVTSSDREWIAEIVTGAFGSVQIVSHGEIIEDASLLSGFAVEHDGRPIGCALVNLVDNVAELVALVTTYRGAGAGTALLEAVVERARNERWARLWLSTSNDNTDAIRMYQRAGWDWVDFRRDAITRARAIKPEIPETGNHGIPIRHEIQFEAPLETVRARAQDDAYAASVAGFVLLAVMGLALCGAIAYFGFAQRQARVRAVAALAQRIGFSFSPRDANGVAQMPFAFFRVGHGQKAELVISGMHNNLPLQIFDYEYYVQGNRSREYHRFTCAILTIPAVCPPLRLSRENMLTRLGDHITHHDVKLEYDDFNRHFVVNCEEQKFAFALLDGQMMEWLLAADTGAPLTRFDRAEIVGPWVLLTHSRNATRRVALNLGIWLDTFHSHIPPIVYSTFPNR